MRIDGTLTPLELKEHEVLRGLSVKVLKSLAAIPDLGKKYKYLAADHNCWKLWILKPKYSEGVWTRGAVDIDEHLSKGALRDYCPRVHRAANLHCFRVKTLQNYLINRGALDNQFDIISKLPKVVLDNLKSKLIQHPDEFDCLTVDTYGLKIWQTIKSAIVYTNLSTGWVAPNSVYQRLIVEGMGTDWFQTVRFADMLIYRISLQAYFRNEDNSEEMVDPEIDDQIESPDNRLDTLEKIERKWNANLLTKGEYKFALKELKAKEEERLNPLKDVPTWPSDVPKSNINMGFTGAEKDQIEAALRKPGVIEIQPIPSLTMLQVQTELINQAMEIDPNLIPRLLKFIINKSNALEHTNE